MWSVGTCSRFSFWAPLRIGDPDPIGTAHTFIKSFSCNTYEPPRKCCKQKTYVLTKPFRCTTYKKTGGGGGLKTKNLKRLPVLVLLYPAQQDGCFI